MKCKRLRDLSFKYEQKWKLILSFLAEWGFLDLVDSGVFFRFCRMVYSFGFPNVTPLTYFSSRHFQVEHKHFI